jgi:hypothetical protein
MRNIGNINHPRIRAHWINMLFCICCNATHFSPLFKYILSSLSDFAKKNIRESI